MLCCKYRVPIVLENLGKSLNVKYIIPGLEIFENLQGP